MKIVYYSKTFFADCDFPLIKALQDKGIDVRYYMSLPRNFQMDNLIELDKPIKRMQLVKASKIKGMEKYKDCIDLNRLYFIAGYPNRVFWFPSWFFWLYCVIHILLQKPDVIHIDWQLSSPFEKLLLLTKCVRKRVMTVHDPIAHTGNYCKKDEKNRKQSFAWANKFILLNKVQVQDFVDTYNIDIENIYFSHLGVYDSISRVKSLQLSFDSPYILFFGYINKYKGLEYLLKAMALVHKDYPELKLIIAGRGDFYFDVNEYMNLDYIEWRNRYIGVAELAGLLHGCICVVCPYTDATQSGVVQTAFSSGVPVIATNVGALPEVVIDGINGLIVKPLDSTELCSAIKKIYSQEDLRVRMVDNVKRFWQNNNSWDSISNDYIDVYLECQNK